MAMQSYPALSGRARNNPIKEVLAAVALLAPLAAIILTIVPHSGPVLVFGTHEVTDRDEFFHAAAVDFGAPELCARIDGKSASRVAFGGDEQITLGQSKCYQDLAQLTQQVRLCENVRSISTLLLDGSGISPEACRRAAAEGGHPGSYSSSPQMRQEALARIGYDIADKERFPPPGKCVYREDLGRYEPEVCYQDATDLYLRLAYNSTPEERNLVIQRLLSVQLPESF